MKITTRSTISRVFWGLFFIAAALLILASGFGFINIGINAGVLVAVLAIAAVALFSAIKLFWGGLFFLVATILVILSGADIGFSLTGTEIGSLYISAAFLTIAFHAIFSFGKKTRHFKAHGAGCGEASATFGGSVKHFNDDEFESASIECNFGNVKAYFDNAKLKGKTATIEIECNFGSVELYVPKNWKIVNQIEESLSGTVEKNHPSATSSSPKVIIAGELNFSGLAITYV